VLGTEFLDAVFCDQFLTFAQFVDGVEAATAHGTWNEYKSAAPALVGLRWF
jgi:hypothetical protein